MTTSASSRQGSSLLLLADPDGIGRHLADFLGNLSRIAPTLTLLPTLADALAAVASGERYDLILVGLPLADTDAETLVATLHAAAPAIPIVVLTQAADEELALIQRGADDCLAAAAATPEAIERMLLHTLERSRLRQLSPSLLTALPTAVFYKDNQGRYLGCNPAFAALTGKSSAEIRGHTVEELWPAQFSNIYRQHDQSLLQEHQQQIYEAQLVDHRGQIRDVLFSKNTFLDEQGQAAGLVGAITDISTIKQSEAQLKESRSRLKSVLATAGVGIAFGDRDGHLLETNSAFDQMLGYREGELTGRGFAEFTHPEDMARERPLLTELTLGQRSSYELEKRYITRGGRVIWVHLNVSGLRNAAGDMDLLVAVASDITARRQFQMDLADSRAFSEAILDSMDISISVLDRDGRIIAVNEGWRRFSQQGNGSEALEDGVGIDYLGVMRRARDQGFLDLVPMLDGLEEVLAGLRDSFTYEYPCDLPQGRLCWYLLRATPMRSQRGGMVVSHIDMTAQHLAQEETLRLKAELEERVERRTASLAEANETLRTEQRKLSFLKDLAERANFSDDLGELLEYGVRELCDMAGWAVAHVLFLNRQGNALESSGIVYSRTPERHARALGRLMANTILPGQSLPGRAWKQGRAIWSHCSTGCPEDGRCRNFETGSIA